MAIVRSIARAVAQPVARPLTGSDGGPPQAPIISSVTISGDTRVGDVLSSSISYTQAPRPGGTPSYQWQRNAVNIAGATGSSYTLVAADAGAAITLVFSVTNSEGSDGPVTSNTINADALSAPVITGVPTISGTPQEGQTLTATEASTAGNPPPATTWQWERDNVAISGATDSTYTLVSADENTDVTVVQTETNTQGSDTAESAATAIQAPPVISGSPTLSGTETVGSTLTATPASVTGTPTPTRSWQWQRSANGTTGWADISGAIASTYTLVVADENQYVRAVQSESNALGDDEQPSASSGQIGPEVSDPYIANGFSPAFVADESLATPYYRVSGSDSDYDTVYTSDTGAGGLATMNDSSGNLVWGPHNLVQYSEQFDNAAWTKGTSTGGVTANAITAPDGTATADLVFADTDAASDQQVIFQNLGATSKSRTFTVAAKSGGYDYVVIILQTSTQGYGASFDLTDGSVVSSRSGVTANPAVDLGSGWWLCSITVEVANNTFAIIQPSPDGVIDSPTGLYRSSYTGDGSSGVYLWGAHAYRSDLGGMADVPADQRATSALTKYVPTTTAAKYLIRRGHHYYDGSEWKPTLLHEPVAATNLISTSKPSTATWTQNSTSISAATGVTGIDGVSGSPVEIVAGSGGTSQFAAAPSGFSSQSGVVWAVAKDAGTGGYLGFAGLGIGTASEVPIFDLVNGTVDFGATSTIVTDGDLIDLSGGWYLCWIRVATSTGSPSIVIAQSATDNTASAYTYTGDDSTSVYVYHAQAETTQLPSSVIITTGTTVTRAADTCKVNAAALPYDATNMSIRMDGRANITRLDGTNRLFGWRGASSSVRIIGRVGSGGVSNVFLQNTSSGQVSSPSVSPMAVGPQQPFNIAYRVVASSTHQVARNGAAGTSAAIAFAMPALSAFDFFLFAEVGFSGGDINGESDTLILWSDDVGTAGIEEATA